MISPYLFVVVILPLLSWAQSSTVINNNDPSIQYLPSFCPVIPPAFCPGGWWNTPLSDGSNIKTSTGPDSQFGNAPCEINYSFQGSGLEIHGLQDQLGAEAIIILDGLTTNYNSSTPELVQQPRLWFSVSNLDPTTSHQVSITWGPSIPSRVNWLYFDHFVVIGQTNGTTSSSTSTSSSSTSTSSSTSITTATSSSPSTPVGAIVGGAIGGLAILTIMVALLLFFRRRRLTKDDVNDRITIESPLPETPVPFYATANQVTAPAALPSTEHYPPPYSPGQLSQYTNHSYDPENGVSHTQESRIPEHTPGNLPEPRNRTKT